MSILITGGTGFIGARIARKLVDRGEEVVCFDSAPPRAGLLPYLDRVKVYRGDVTQIPHLLEAVERHRVHKIIHLAALLPPDSEDRPHFGMYVNIQGTNNVFEAARWTGVRRVVYASSIAVYGAQEAFGDRAASENDPPNPVNVYGMTKAANDFAAAKYIDLYGLDLRGVRICTVFGHGRTTGQTGMIGGLLVSMPAVGKPVALPFHPEDRSSMIYAADAAEIFVRVALSDRLSYRVYNSGGHTANVREMADIVRSFIPDALITMGDSVMRHVSLVDNSRMLEDLGYELPPLRIGVLEHINEARAEAGLPAIAG